MSNRMRCVLLCAGLMAIVGCSDDGSPTAPATQSATHGTAPTSKEEAQIEAALKELPDEDRTLAKAQKFCAVSEQGRLGSMGKPVKIELEGKPVFLCCEGCESVARKDPQATLAKVEKLKAANQ